RSPDNAPLAPRPERLLVLDAPLGRGRGRTALVIAARAPDVEAVGMKHGGAAARRAASGAGPAAGPCAAWGLVVPVVDPVRGRIAVLAEHRIDDVALIEHVVVELEVRH